MARAATALIVFFSLAPFLYAFGFCFPRGDDFDGVTRAAFLFDLPGALYEAGREWLTWSGRYLYHFLAVFLGKAASSRALYGLTCLGVVLLYGFAVFWLARRVARVKFAAALACAALWTLSLFACYGNLPDFYLLTDALTIILQGALFFLFLALYLDYLQTNRGFAFVAATIILAVGAYECAGIAIFSTLLVSLAAARLRAPAQPPNLVFFRGAWKLFLVTILALCASFLAPGNLARARARPLPAATLWEQIRNVPREFFNLHIDFLASPWAYALPCLVLAALAVKKTARKSRVALAVAFAWFLFCPLFLLLLALGDAPYSSSPKFPAAMSLYLALALFLVLYCAAPRPNFSPLIKKFVLFLALALFFCVVARGHNFRETAINAANGQLLAYADFMERRDAYIRAMAAPFRKRVPAFGLPGEWRDPKVRSKVPFPWLPAAEVPVWPYEAFPAKAINSLACEFDAWPNKWAAWTYGVGKIRAFPLARAEPLAMARKGEGVELALPAINPPAGVGAIWLEIVPVDKLGEQALWLVISPRLEKKILILRPSPPDWRRLLPLPAQRAGLNWLLARETVQNNFFTRLLCREFMAPPGKEAEAIWLGEPGAPLELFAGDGDDAFIKLMPYK